MFFKLVKRNSRRSRKENGLFFASLIISIMAFYIILSLSNQDVMIFLSKMESDAVNRLMKMIPVFYCMTLFILFFLIYYASKFELERRKHEFGVYLMMGMRRSKLFAMLMAEDLRSSIVSLAIGLPSAILLSELISLITARLVGLGIIGHQISFSVNAVIWTALGFILIKLAAFLILSGKITRQEIGSLLSENPEGTKKQRSAFAYALATLAGVLFLIKAYSMAITGVSWYNTLRMGFTVILGITGTLFLFYGLRFLIGILAKRGRRNLKLRIFNFRQLQENVIHRSGTLAISSILVTAALCCFGAGVSIAHFYQDSGEHVLDYTFNTYNTDINTIKKTLTDHELNNGFSHLIEIKTGHIKTDDENNKFKMDSVMSALSQLDESQDKEVLLNNLGYMISPHSSPRLISQSGYDELLAAAGLPPLNLADDEVAVYMDSENVADGKMQILNDIIKNRPEVKICGRSHYLTNALQTTDIVTDRSITLYFAIILPDDMFDYYTKGEHSSYLDGILKTSETENVSLMQAISNMNQKLDKTGLRYESYLQNMGRQLFYIVSASYITIYLAVIFLIISNTIIGVQFLMSQQKSNRRYKTLIRLGATYETLCRSSKKQINWYFGIPVIIAAVNSLFGARALFTGLLPSGLENNFNEMLLVAGAMILLLCIIECIYITAVKHSSNKYLLTLMVPEREE